MKSNIDLGLLSAELEGAASILDMIGDLCGDEDQNPSGKTVEAALFSVSALINRVSADMSQYSDEVAVPNNA